MVTLLRDIAPVTGGAQTLRPTWPVVLPATLCAAAAAPLADPSGPLLLGHRSLVGLQPRRRLARCPPAPATWHQETV